MPGCKISKTLQGKSVALGLQNLGSGMQRDDCENRAMKTIFMFKT